MRVTNPWVAAAVDSLVGNVVGAGIKPQSTHPDRAVREKLQALWLRCCAGRITPIDHPATAHAARRPSPARWPRSRPWASLAARSLHLICNTYCARCRQRHLVLRTVATTIPPPLAPPVARGVVPRPAV